MRTSLIISTYNREDALDLVLKSVSALKVHPHEVIIADDGSGLKTAELIHRHQKSFPIPLIHCHQEDKGFRLSHIRNKATALSSGDHLIFIDGGHDYEIVKNDFDIALKNVNKNGTIIFHDIAASSCHGPKKLWGEIKKKFDTKEFVSKKYFIKYGVGIINIK